MNIDKYSDRVKGFIQSAQTKALADGHQQFSPEHLLKVLLDDPEGLGSIFDAKSRRTSKGRLIGCEAASAKFPKVQGGNGQLYLSQTLAKVLDTAEKAADKAGDFT